MSAPTPNGTSFEFPVCGRIEIDRSNLGLFTFWGNKAAYNHVFVGCHLPQHPTPEDVPDDLSIPRGHYVFAHEAGFVTLREIIVANEFEQHLNQSDDDLDPRDIFMYDLSKMAEFKAAYSGTLPS